MDETLEIIQMYKTTDGKTFESKNEAIEHQIDLNKPKIYLVKNCCDSSTHIEKAFMTRKSAEEFEEKLRRDYNDSYTAFCIVEVELGE